MAVAITGSPTAYPTNLAWTRNGPTMTLKWESTDSNATSESNERRVEYGYRNAVFFFGLNDEYVGESQVVQFSGIGGESSFDLVDGTHMIKLGSVTFYNSAGYTLSWIPSHGFYAPRKPTIESVEYDHITSKITFKIEGYEAVQDSPRKAYHIQATRQGVLDGATVASKVAFSEDVLGWDSNTEQYTYTKTITDDIGITKQEDYILYRFETYAVGIPANSEKAVQELYIGYPTKAVILNYQKVRNGGNVTLGAYSAKNPAETIQLQIQYARSLENLSESNWTDVGDVYEYSNKSLPINDSDITPEVEQHVYFRVKSCLYDRYSYSDAYAVDDKFYYWSENYHEDEDPNIIQIVKTANGEDSESVEIVIGYFDDSNYDACLLSYSTDKRAWTSTAQPTTFEMPDSQWQDPSCKSDIHPCSSSITVLDLEADTTYYFRARRYKTSDDTRNTRYSMQVAQSTSQEKLTGLALTASDIIATGKECAFTWEFPEGLKQVAWTLKDADTGAGLATSTGSLTLTTFTFARAGKRNIILQATFSDGRSVDSNTVTVDVRNAPMLKFVKAPTATLTALPQEFAVSADNADAEIQVKVSCVNSNKAVKPSGDVEQYAGDIVYSEQGTGSITCTITDGAKLWNNGRYKVEVIATANSVKSDPLTAMFNVNYSAKVGAPTKDDVEITTADRTANVTVNNLSTGITWDLYRATSDQRNVLIASELSSGTTITDNYAPYALDSACEYVVLVKNAQQQYAFAPFEYSAKRGSLRFDWENKSVELPYNIKISDETDKQFDQQVYLDGTQRGTWGASVVRTSSLSTDTIYIKDEKKQKLVRELARYQGEVFVRTPLGQAYCANVEVNDISKDYDANAMAVSFNCTEVDLTNDFMATINQKGA